MNSPNIGNSPNIVNKRKDSARYVAVHRIFWSEKPRRFGAPNLFACSKCSPRHHVILSELAWCMWCVILHKNYRLVEIYISTMYLHENIIVEQLWPVNLTMQGPPVRVAEASFYIQFHLHESYYTCIKDLYYIYIYYLPTWKHYCRASIASKPHGCLSKLRNFLLYPISTSIFKLS